MTKGARSIFEQYGIAPDDVLTLMVEAQSAGDNATSRDCLRAYFNRNGSVPAARRVAEVITEARARGAE